jgi:hypothetical protein
MRFNRNTIFEQFGKAKVVKADKQPDKPVESEQQPLRRRRIARQRGSFVTNW